jgi:hypothetical protein
MYKWPLVIAAGVALLAGAPKPAHALFGSNATVTITGNGTADIHVDVLLAPAFTFMSSGAGDASFAFSLVGDPAATITNFVNSGGTHGGLCTSSCAGTNTWTFVDPGTANSLHEDGAGYFSDGFTWNAGNGWTNHDGTEISFDITSGGNNITLATSTDKNGANPTSFLFAADVGNCAPTATSCGSTGIMGITANGVPGPIAGAGLPGLILACGGLIALARRRRASAMA